MHVKSIPSINNINPKIKSIVVKLILNIVINRNKMLDIDKPKITE